MIVVNAWKNEVKDDTKDILRVCRVVVVSENFRLSL